VPLCTWFKGGPRSQHDPGGIEVFEAGWRVCPALRRENHTFKRADRSARVQRGIGNAYSDEILHAAAAVTVQADAEHRRRRGGAL
jgi:hypothetical protein